MCTCDLLPQLVCDGDRHRQQLVGPLPGDVAR